MSHDDKITQILSRTGSADDTLWAFHALLDDVLSLPVDARVGGDRVLLEHIDYGGYPEQGLLAQVRRGDTTFALPLSQVLVLKRVDGSDVVRAYQSWFRGRLPTVSAPSAPSTPRSESPDPGDDGGPLSLVVLTVRGSMARCRRLDSGADVVLRLSTQQRVAPGAIVEVTPAGPGIPLSGAISGVRVDVSALGLSPPALTIVRGGEPAIYSLEAARDVGLTDTIEQADGLASAGDPRGARQLIFDALTEGGLVVIDAHRALGDIALNDEGSAHDALIHYAIGAAIGDLTVPDPLDGQLPAELPDNYAYLACLFGCGRALSRLGRRADAGVPLRRLLALDPVDAFGAQALLVGR